MDDNPDWPPQASAVGLLEGTLRYGSTGQLFEVKNGRWERASDVPHDDRKVTLEAVENEIRKAFASASARRGH